MSHATETGIKSAPAAPGRNEAPAVGATVLCSRCRARLKAGALFCSNCGMQQPARAGGPAAQNHSKALPIIVIGATALVATAIIVFGFRPAAPEPQPQPAPGSVSTVYVPAPPPREPLVTPVAPDPKPTAAAPPALQPTTQIVQLPRQIHYYRIKTQMLGSTTDGGPFEIMGQGHEPIIGFRVTTAPWDGKSIVRTLQPIYPSDNCVPTRSMVVARQGYAVGGVDIDGDNDITAMRIVFMRIEPHGLSVKDAYESDWIGEPTGSTTYLLGGHGQPVIGIYGRRGMNYAALGLILLDEKME